jgi:hypothetical protein
MEPEPTTAKKCRLHFLLLVALLQAGQLCAGEQQRGGGRGHSSAGRGRVRTTGRTVPVIELSFFSPCRIFVKLHCHRESKAVIVFHILHAGPPTVIHAFKRILSLRLRFLLAHTQHAFKRQNFEYQL